MRTRITAALCWALFLLAPGAAGAQSTLVSGWDFSQYFGDGLMSIDGATFTNTLDANYSDLLPAPGVGPSAAAFGTFYADGSFGSTSVDPSSPSAEFLPSAAAGGSLLSNLTAPAFTDFDSFTFLADEGQLFTESLAMIAPAAATVVFEADLTSSGQTGSNWLVSFGALAFSGTSSVSVEFSSDGVNFTSFGNVNLTTVDTLFEVPLGADSTDLAYVRLGFAPSGPDQPLLDNVAIFADVGGGPTTTTTTSTSTTTLPGGTTTTTTTLPGGTTTTIVTTTTTVAPTTTTAPTTTVPTTSTTSTTLPPGDLSGEYQFVDSVKRSIDESNQSFANIDTPSGQFCLAGLVRGTDTTHVPNREVTFEYRSNGTIRNANARNVNADFPGVDLTLTIEDSSGTLFENTVGSGCKLKGKLKRSGDQDKTRLRCRLNTNLIDLELPADLVSTVIGAFPKQKHIKIDALRGKVRVTQRGVPAGPGAALPLDCPISGGA